ncbi:hypothetical protein EfmJHP38_04970 [Enterococcus faecium]|nr:hypothetical protein EfmJHP38_04970 [Enterococcus faecium]
MFSTRIAENFSIEQLRLQDYYSIQHYFSLLHKSVTIASNGLSLKNLRFNTFVVLASLQVE